MKWFAFLLTVVLCAQASDAPSWASAEEIEQWEKEATSEINKYKTQYPEKEFLLYMIAGRELAAYGMTKKSREYYLKAFNHSYEGDKTEAVVQLLALSGRDQNDLKRAQAWFDKNPTKKTPELTRWLTLMEGHLQGNTPTENLGYFKSWAMDSRVTELMKEGKTAEAFQLLGPRELKEADINQRVRQDLLAAATLGKSATPPLWCKPTLKKYPESVTWSMRVCRYLDDWKSGKKSRENIESIRAQLKKENPERLYWVTILERL